MGAAQTTRSIEIHAGDVASEFPDYPLKELPNLCQAWQDKSWHNDVCPSFVTRVDAGGRTYLAVLWCEYPDPALRELPGQARLFVVIYDVTDDEDRDCYYRGEHELSVAGETVNDLIEGLVDGAPEAMHLVKEGDHTMEGVRLHKAVTHRAARLAAEVPTAH